MLKAIYKPNARVLFDHKPADVTVLPNNKICLSFIGLDFTTVLTETQIHQYFGNKLKLMSDKKPTHKPLNLTLEQQLEFDRRQAYINELKRVSKTGGCGGDKLRLSVIKRVKEEIKDPNPPSKATLARWYQTALAHSQGVAATILKNKRIRRSGFSDDVKDLFIRAVDMFYLHTGKPTIQYAYDHFKVLLDETLGEDADRPCYHTFRKWIYDLIHPLDMIAQRDGKKAVRAARRNNVQKLIAEHIHERAEADAVHLAVGIVDDHDNYLGTVTLYAIIDCYSRAITGIKVQVGRGETTASVIDCVRHAISEKAPDSYSHEAVNDWPMYGSPCKIVTDGGPGYSSLKAVSFYLDCESQHELAETSKGWRKPFIESFFSTLRAQFAKTLPGYCGKYTDQRELDHTVEQQACMTKAQFESALTHWIIDEYHQATHSGLDNNKTPYQVWEESALEYPPNIPANYQRLLLTKGEELPRKIMGDAGNQGVQINYLKYNDVKGHLQAIYAQLKQQRQDPYVMCEYSPNDISYINVFDPFTDEVFMVDCVDPRVDVDMSLAEFQTKFPPQKKDKGFGRVRIDQKSEVLNEARDRHHKKTKPKPKKSKTFKTDELTEMVNAAQEYAFEPTPFDDDVWPGQNTSVPPVKHHSSTEAFDYD